MKTLTLRKSLFVAMAATSSQAQPARADAPQVSSASLTHAQNLERWRGARFGMFIHWGPVSLKGTEIGWSRGKQVPQAEYDSLYKQFNPTEFSADAWVSVAKAAGMKYIVLTTKHHDGFCLWDTQHTDYNITISPFKRDVVKELAEACKKQGIDFGTYYSVTDWYRLDYTRSYYQTKRETSNLDRYTQYLKNQTRELVTKYGPLLTMWFDVPEDFDKTRGQGVIDYLHTLQPNLLVNDRTGAPGDYSTPEQHIGGFDMERPWETCMTIANQWAWKPNDDMKSLEQCLQTLILSASGDGNLLFNVGPMPTGEIEGRQVDRLKEMGAWLQKNGESIYGTRGGPFKPTKTYGSTRKGNTIYLHILKTADGKVTLPSLPKKIVGASTLGGEKVDVQQTPGGTQVTLSAAQVQAIDTIIKLELDGPAMDIAPIAPL